MSAWDVAPMSGTVKTYAGAFTELTDGEFGIGDITAPAAAGLDVLSWVCDPAGALVNAAIGPLLDYLANNLPPLKIPLDKLTGDAAAIQAHATAWQTLSDQIVQVGNEYARTGGDLPSWTQPASGIYRDIQQGLVEAYQGTANQAASVANSVATLGQVCAGVRAFIWGLVKSFISSAIGNAIVAAASAVVTCGGSLAAFGTWFSSRFAVVVMKISGKLSKLMSYLAKVTAKFGKLSAAFTKAAEKLSKMSMGKFQMAGTKANQANWQATHSARGRGDIGPKDKIKIDREHFGPGDWQKDLADKTKHTKWPGKVNGAVNSGDKAERDDVGTADRVDPLS